MKNTNIKLCVNIDHIATLRQARGGTEPDPLAGARICEENGADGITAHLREDRRHIQDRDVIALKNIIRGKYNLEMALSDDIINVAAKIIPHQVTLVPERREEVTTEGGLNVKKYINKIKDAVAIFHNLGITVSLFIEPDEKMVELSKKSGADYIEIHTGAYCNAVNPDDIKREITRIHQAADCAIRAGIRINAGHGLNYTNIHPVLETPGLEELNIGHSIISRSIFYGLAQSVKDVLKLIKE